MREVNERYFYIKVSHLPKLKTGDWVYMDNSHTSKKHKPNTATQHLSRKLVPKKDGLFTVLQEKNRTVTVDVHDVHNTMSTGIITLTEKAMEATYAAQKEGRGVVQNT